MITTLPALPVTGVIALTIISQAFSYALSVRDGGGDNDGTWQPGDVLHILLTNNNDKSYSLPVQMGTPFQEVLMAVSLSQNHILVASPESVTQSGFYNPLNSTSFQPGGDETTSITGLDGNPVDVAFVEESCKILDFAYNASLALTPPTAKGNVYPNGTHGVLGYGVKRSPGIPSDRSLLNIYFPPNITSVECGIELGRADDGSRGGVFTMGGRDTSASVVREFTGNFTTMVVPSVATVSYPSWSIPLDQMLASITGKFEHIISTQGIASIDPYFSQAAVYPGNTNRYTVPCGTKIHITMTFGGKNFTVDPRDAIIKETDMCFGTIEIGSDNFFKIGNPFLSNVYTVFGADFSGLAPSFTVAFANKAHNAAATIKAPTTGLSIFLLLVVISISLANT